MPLYLLPLRAGKSKYCMFEVLGEKSPSKPHLGSTASAAQADSTEYAQTDSAWQLELKQIPPSDQVDLTPLSSKNYRVLSTDILKSLRLLDNCRQNVDKVLEVSG
ncbi:hypothetical protein TKK_0017198 [Trichogramma kaykai]